MSLAHGYNNWLAWAEEVTFGTPVVATKKVEIESESLDCEQKKNPLALLGHVSQRRTVTSKKSVGGSVRFPFLWEGCEQWLKHAIGSVVTTGTNPYTHTFSLAADLPVGLTLELPRDDGAIAGSAAYQYAGCKISKLTLDQQHEQPLMLDIEILGRDRAMLATTSLSFPTYDAADYAQMTVFAIDPSGGSEFVMPLRSLKLTIDNSLHADQYRLGSALRAGITRGGQRKVTAEIELEYESLTGLAFFRNLVNDNIRFKWVNGAKSLQLDLANCSFEGKDPSTGDPGPIYVTMPITGLANSADNDELVAVLINTVSSV